MSAKPTLMKARPKTNRPPKGTTMKRFETITAQFPNVGLALSPLAETLPGQLASIGFTCQDEQAPGINWLIADEDAEAVKARHPGVPVLKVNSKVSIYGLKQAIVALLDSPNAA
jgi:hypothetical protein